MNWQKIFIDYWGQTTLILLSIAYFIKRIFDNKPKKLEINYSLFQQNRLTAVDVFFKNCAKAELMWYKLQIWNIVSQKLTATEMDKIIIPPVNEVRQSVFKLKIYFGKETHKSFEQLLDNFLILNSELMDIYFSTKDEEKNTQKANRFERARLNTFRKNNIIIEEICKAVKRTFQ